MLTGIFTLNIATFILYKRIPIVTATYTLGASFAAIDLYAFIAYRFFDKEKYKVIVDELRKGKKKKWKFKKNVLFYS